RRPGEGEVSQLTVAEAPAPASATAAPRRRSGRRAGVVGRREWLWGYAFIAPTGLGLLVFYLWPVIQTGYYSFTEWGTFGGHEWVGWANFAKLVHDPEVGNALRNPVV